jgi:ribosome-binding factor A
MSGHRFTLRACGAFIAFCLFVETSTAQNANPQTTDSISKSAIQAKLDAIQASTSLSDSSKATATRLYKEILSELLLGQIKDPRVGMVTITSVRVSSDLSTAKVFYSVMGDENDRGETERGLKSARNFMRKVLADELKLRSAPELRFVYDDSLDRSFAIDEALKKSHEQDKAEETQSEETQHEEDTPDTR